MAPNNLIQITILLFLFVSWFLKEVNGSSNFIMSNFMQNRNNIFVLIWVGCSLKPNGSNKYYAGINTKFITLFPKKMKTGLGCLWEAVIEELMVLKP